VLVANVAERVDGGRVVPTRLGLLLTFMKIGVVGFGGVGPWARRVIVEERGWLDEREYADTLAICGVLPGPNVGNVSIFVGDRFHGLLGSCLALTGLMSGPLAIMLTLGYLYAWLGELPAIDGAIGGVAAAAAGLFLGTGLKMAQRLRLSPAELAIAISAFVAIGLLRWPLVPVVLTLGPIGIVLSWRYRW
jgi:chromate transporter